jgi:hypothetical protein
MTRPALQCVYGRVIGDYSLKVGDLQYFIDNGHMYINERGFFLIEFISGIMYHIVRYMPLK